MYPMIRESFNEHPHLTTASQKLSNRIHGKKNFSSLKTNVRSKVKKPQTEKVQFCS